MKVNLSASDYKDLANSINDGIHQGRLNGAVAPYEIGDMTQVCADFYDYAQIRYLHAMENPWLFLKWLPDEIKMEIIKQSK